MVGEIIKAFQRKEQINSLADKVEEFFKDFTHSDRNTRMVLPTYVLPLDDDKNFVEALADEISTRSAPLHNYMYLGRIQGVGKYLHGTIILSHYNLNVDVVPRPEGGHHC